MATAPFSHVDQLLETLETLGEEPVEDVVPAKAHLLQTAELLAASHPDDPELVAAGLVHDIATALGYHDEAHERAGADLVTPLLGARVGALVAGHVDAKRYLVATDPTYGSALSADSTMSLRAQGGALDDSEISSFESRADWRAMLALRRADDAAKVPGAPVRPVAEWRGLLQSTARR
jgi:predicted HD phosphohydrolase